MYRKHNKWLPFVVGREVAPKVSTLKSLEPVNMLPYLANQGTGLHAVKIRQEKQWSMVHWSCLERFTPRKSSNATPENSPPHPQRTRC